MSDFAMSFRGTAARRPAPSDPLIQWASGLPTTNRTIYAGWMIEVGKDEDLDRAMHTAGFATVTIKHGNGAVVQHWAVATADVFVIADGLQSATELRSTPERYGVAYWWTETEDRRKQSQLRARVMLRALLQAGYDQPLTLTVKSTLTGDVLQALGCIYDLLDAVKQLSGNDLPFYAFSLPIGPGESVRRGKGENTKEVVIPVAVLPETITREWLVEHFTKKEWTTRIESLLDETIRWSTQTSVPTQEEAVEDVAQEAAPQPVQAAQPQATGIDATEAAARFYARYGAIIGGNTFTAVTRWLGVKREEPTTIQGWVDLAYSVRATKEERERQSAAEMDEIDAGTALFPQAA